MGDKEESKPSIDRFKSLQHAGNPRLKISDYVTHTASIMEFGDEGSSEEDNKLEETKDKDIEAVDMDKYLFEESKSESLDEDFEVEEIKENIDEMEDKELLQFGRKVAAAIHFLFYECRLKVSGDSDTNLALGDYGQIPNFFQMFFIPNQAANRRNSATLDEHTAGVSMKKKKKIKAMAPTSPFVSSRNLNSSFAAKDLISKRKSFVTKDFGSMSPRNAELTSDDDSLDMEPILETESIIPVYPLLTLVNQPSVNLVAKNIYLLYKDSLTDLQFSNVEMDQELLELYRGKALNMNWIASEMKTRPASKLVEENSEHYMELITRLVECYNLHTGFLFFAKLKTHVIFWRSVCTRAFVEFPFLSLIDNLITFMIHIHDYEYLPEVPLPDLSDSRNSSFSSSIPASGGLLKLAQEEEYQDVFSKTIVLNKAIESSSVADFDEEKDADVFMSTSNKETATLDINSKTVKRHFITGLVLFILSMCGIAVTWEMWYSAGSDIINDSLLDLTRVVSIALLQTTEEFTILPPIVQSSNFALFNSSRINVTLMTTDGLNDAEDYYFDMVYAFGVDGLYLGTEDDTMLGCFHQDEEWYFLLKNSSISSVLYKKTFNVLDSVRYNESDYISIDDNYNVKDTEWYITGDALVDNVNEDIDMGWTGIYSKRNRSVLSLVTRKNNDGFNGISGLDLSLQVLHVSLNDKVISSFSNLGAVFAFNPASQVIYYGNSPTARFDFTHTSNVSDPFVNSVLEMLKEKYSSYDEILSTNGEVMINVTPKGGKYYIYIDEYCSGNGIDLLLITAVDISVQTSKLNIYNWVSLGITLYAASLVIIYSTESFKKLHNGTDLLKIIFDLIFTRKKRIEKLKTVGPSEVNPEPVPIAEEAGGRAMERKTEAFSSKLLACLHGTYLKTIGALFSGLRGLVMFLLKTCFTLYARISYNYGMYITCFCIVVLWFVWAAASVFSVEHIADSYLDQSLELVFERVQEEVEIPFKINDLNYVLYKAGGYSTRVDDYSSRDVSFNTVMSLFRDKDGSFIVDGMYIAIDDSGLFSGSQQYHNSDGSVDLVVLARDNQTGFCYTKYSTSEYGTRDEQVFTSSGCLYDPRERHWYIKAKEAKEAVWSDVYTFISGDVGVTLALPFYESGVFLGVIASDFKLDHINDILLDINLANTTLTDDQSIIESRQFLMTKVGILVASSESEVTKQQQDGAYLLLNATETSDLVTKETAITVLSYFQYLKLLKIELNDTVTNVERSLEDPLTYIRKLDERGGMDWIMVLAVMPEAYFGALTDARFLTVLYVAATLAFLLYISSMGFRVQEVQENAQDDDDMDGDSDVISVISKSANEYARIRIAVDSTKLGYWKHQMDFIIKQDLVSIWHEYICTRRQITGEGNLALHGPTPSKEFVHECIDRSKFHIRTSEKNRDVLYIILLNGLRRHKFVYQLYRFTRQISFRLVVNFCFFLVHLSLGVQKENTPQLLLEHGTVWWVIIIEGIVLAIEIFEALSELIVLLTLKKTHKDAFVDKLRAITGEELKSDENFSETLDGFFKSKYANDLRRLSLLIVLLLVVLGDWLLIIYYRWSIEYYLPIRVCIPILMNGSVRSVGLGFWKTIRGAKSEFLLYGSAVMFSAVTASVLFRTEINASEVENSYTNIIRSITTSFVFFSTGENYTELVYKAFDSNALYVLYYVIVTILGTFIVMAFVLSRFVTGFTREFQSDILKKKQYSRSGIISAFLLLDMDHSGDIPGKTLKEFYNAVWPEHNPDLENNRSLKYLKRRQRRVFISKCTCLEDFVEAIEDLYEEKRVSQYNERYYKKAGLLGASTTLELVEQHSHDLTQLQSEGVSEIMFDGSKKDAGRATLKKQLFKIICHPLFNNLITMIVILQTIFLSFYDWNYNVLLDGLNICIIFLFTIELLLKIYTYGFAAFISPTHYKFDTNSKFNRPEYQVANRMDLFAITLSCFCVILGITISGGISFEELPNLRFGMAFSVVRIFSQVTTTRQLIYPIFMSEVVKQFGYLFLLLLLVMYVFAYYGMLLFHDKFKQYILLDDTPQGQFDSLTRSFLLLFQLLVGEGWHDVMYAGIRVSGNFVVAWYFILYIFIVTLLFSNIFISLVLAIMEKFRGSAHLTAREFEKRMISTNIGNYKH